MLIKRLLSIGVLALLNFQTAWAAPLGSREVHLSTPVGGDVLPGGGFAASDIRTSFIFAKLIPFILRYIIGLGASLAVVALIIGGYQFLASYGNTETHQSAIKTIQYALIGLIVMMVAFGIVTIITNFTFS